MKSYEGNSYCLAHFFNLNILWIGRGCTSASSFANGCEHSYPQTWRCSSWPYCHFITLRISFFVPLFVILLHSLLPVLLFVLFCYGKVYTFCCSNLVVRYVLVPRTNKYKSKVEQIQPNAYSCLFIVISLRLESRFPSIFCHLTALFSFLGTNTRF